MDYDRIIANKYFAARVEQFFALTRRGASVDEACRQMRTGRVQTSACNRCGSQLTPMQHDYHRCDDAVRAPLIIPIAVPYPRSQEGRCA